MVFSQKLSVVAVSLAALFLCKPTYLLAGASGPTAGNQNANEAADDPEPKTSVSARKSAVSVDSPTRAYAVIEGKHVLTDYYNVKGDRLKSDPAFHGRMQLGVRMYGDKLDISAAGGVVKLPASQAMFQKRPELLVDVYPIKGQTLNVLFYNMLQFPVREIDRDPTEFMDKDLYEQDSKRGIDSTVYTVGLAPIVKAEWRTNVGKFLLRAGADGWTKMYSKPQYVNDSNTAGGDGVGLVSSSESEVDHAFEDRALRYVHQESVGVGYTPGFAPAVSVDVGAHIESRYIPQYFRDEAGRWDYAYFPERRSFWRTRLALDLNKTVSIQDELYVFRNGFFKENRLGEEHRVRNIVRLAIKL